MATVASVPVYTLKVSNDSARDQGPLSITMRGAGTATICLITRPLATDTCCMSGTFTRHPKGAMGPIQ